MNNRVLLIIPCYNEEKRIRSREFLENLPSGVSLLFANDGSKDATIGVLTKLRTELKNKQVNCEIFSAEKNVGKAEVIRLAYQFALQNGLLSGQDWVGFWDADLSTPLFEIKFLVQYRNNFSPQYGAIFASRINRYGSHIVRKMSRHYLSRIFVTFTDVILGIKAYDSQCGAKLFVPELAAKAFAEPFVSRWIFDLEIILRIGADAIVEVPLQGWIDVSGSKIRVLRESFGVLSDLFRIKNKYK